MSLLDNNVIKKINDIKKDNFSGASELIEKVLDTINYQLELIEDENLDIKEEITQLSKKIINSRASMAPLINTIGYLVHDLKNFNKSVLKTRIKQFSSHKEKQFDEMKKSFEKYLKLKEKINFKVMLMSYSSTIIKLLTSFKQVNFEFYVLESRPLYEGRKTAEILSKFFKVHLIIDAALGKFIDQIDFVLIGADNILKDGTIINKIGTYPLCALAKLRSVEVLVVADTFKYNLKSHFNLKVDIELKNPEEVYHSDKQNENITVHNYYFDKTPAKYIDSIISDIGKLTPAEFLFKIKSVLPLNWFMNF